MKLFTLSLGLAWVAAFIPRATCQDNRAEPGQIHVTRPIPGGRGSRVVLSASTIQRDLTNKSSEPILHLRGNVELKMITCARSPQGAVACDGAMVLHADSVDYNEQTGSIDAQGNVHIAPHKITQR